MTSTSRSSRYRVYLHLDTGGAWVNGGHAIPLRLLSRFITDGKIQPVWETQGRPVSVGRSMRILPQRTRRLITDRDRGCRFPGCPTTTFVEIHHLNAWADGGPTDEHNQISLCTIHHDGIDRGDYTITGNPTHPDGLTVVNRYGLPIRPPQPQDTAPPPDGDPPIPAHTYHPPSGDPIHWTDLELLPDTDLPPQPPPHTQSPTGTDQPGRTDWHAPPPPAPRNAPSSTPASCKKPKTKPPPTATPSSAATTDSETHWQSSRVMGGRLPDDRGTSAMQGRAAFCRLTDLGSSVAGVSPTQDAQASSSRRRRTSA